MSASVRKVAGLVAALALSAVVMVGCGGDDNPGGNSGGSNNGGGDSYNYTGRTVEIGGLTWMAENLNRATSNSWCYNNADSNCVKYGRLYTWEAAKTACPSGWRLPDTADWRRLVEVAGGSSVGGSTLKSTSGWHSNGNGTDEFGFSALPGGYRVTNGTFFNAGYGGYWWSATERGSGSAWRRAMYYTSGLVIENDSGKGHGFSARCVR
ncbi:MAG: fibrobacter succinogenes major paralogous domain-containing protein [Chitinispirillia bacterium]|nr:fibrobacter succinogenes major paralogous domain-containing protein [Chitinispirillia bacterium]